MPNFFDPARGDAELVRVGEHFRLEFVHHGAQSGRLRQRHLDMIAVNVNSDANVHVVRLPREIPDECHHLFVRGEIGLAGRERRGAEAHRRVGIVLLYPLIYNAPAGKSQVVGNFERGISERY